MSEPNWSERFNELKRRWHATIAAAATPEAKRAAIRGYQDESRVLMDRMADCGRQREMTREASL